MAKEGIRSRKVFCQGYLCRAKQRKDIENGRFLGGVVIGIEACFAH